MPLFRRSKPRSTRGAPKTSKGRMSLQPKSAGGKRKSPPPPPPPPSRRPNVAERISMLQMAQLAHKNTFVPSGGIPLVLPEVTPRAKVGARGNVTVTLLVESDHHGKGQLA